MLLRNLLSGLSLLFISVLTAQTPAGYINVEHSCGYTEAVHKVAAIYEFSTNAEAEAVMNDIIGVVGLKPNFKVLPADVPNAAAIVSERTRYILYNPEFIQSVEQGTQTNWSAISILAHEIGHHLNGHTLTNLGSRPRMELEADEFSGFILRKMDASLEEAQAAMQYLASPQGSATHPPRNQRLTAIEKGWKQADEMFRSYEVPDPKVTENEPACPDDHAQGQHTSTNPGNSGEPGTSHPSFARWKVSMTSNPGRDYYITTGDVFVVFRNGKVYELGKFGRTNNDRYPYVIKIENSPDLLISRTGELISIKGKTIGNVVKL